MTPKRRLPLNLTKLLLSFILSFSISLEGNAHEGATGAGDGGHGVQCSASRYFNFEDYAVYSLDLFEASVVYGLQPSFGLGRSARFPRLKEPAESVRVSEMKQVVDLITRRSVEALGARHPFISVLNEFYSLSSLVVFSKQVSNTSDQGFLKQEYFLPSCDLIQVAKRVVTAEGTRFVINEKTWKMMPMNDRIGVLLHEVLHSWFAPHNLDTVAVRQAVIYLSAHDKFRAKHLNRFRELVNTRKALVDGYN